MITRFIWANDFGEKLCLNAGDLLDNLCELLSNIECFGAVLCRGNDNDCFSDEFSQWIFGCENSLFMDDKKLLLRILSKCEVIDDEIYFELHKLVQMKNRNEELLMLVDVADNNELVICDIQGYEGARDYQITNLIRKSEFYDIAKVSYPSLFFHEMIKSSINSLKVPFEQEAFLIVKHLRILDRNYSFWEKGSDQGYELATRSFSSQTGIECSTLNNRKGAEKLRYGFCNNEGKTVHILCELHTKLKFANMNREKQDRIYFHPPVDNVEDGKLLIAYIGKHL